MSVWEHLESSKHHVRLGLKEKENGWHNPQEMRLLSFRNKHSCWRGWRSNYILHAALVEPETWDQASSRWQSSSVSLRSLPKGILPEDHYTVLRGGILQLSKWRGMAKKPKIQEARESKQYSRAFISVTHCGRWLKDPLLMSVVKAMCHSLQKDEVVMLSSHLNMGPRARDLTR